MLEPLPTLRAPQTPPLAHARNLPRDAALDWLLAGLADVRAQPVPSLVYGLGLTAISYAALFVLYSTGLLYLALPAIAGFLIVGPFLAIGLYEKSRRRAEGKTTSLGKMLLARPAAGGQLAYAGLFLGLLILLWLRAADLLYALYFGLRPFLGVEQTLVDIFTTFYGLSLFVVGCLVGGIFAAFAFAVSLFSVPMLVAEKRDALTAMGKSFAMTTQNLRVTLVWGFIVAVGLGISFMTGLLALPLIFPVLGHGTWHAYRAISGDK